MLEFREYISFVALVIIGMISDLHLGGKHMSWLVPAKRLVTPLFLWKVGPSKSSRSFKVPFFLRDVGYSFKSPKQQSVEDKIKLFLTSKNIMSYYELQWG